LKPVDRCAQCGEWFGDIEADDAAPWFTILLAAVAVVPLFFVLQKFIYLYFIATVLFLSIFILAIILIMLPRMKGLLVSAFWFSRLSDKPRG
jgi:uncharacterized protein (DUF983 family)